MCAAAIVDGLVLDAIDKSTVNRSTIAICLFEIKVSIWPATAAAAGFKFLDLSSFSNPRPRIDYRSMKLPSSAYLVLLVWPAITHSSDSSAWHLPLIGYPVASPVHSFVHVANSSHSVPQSVVLTVTDRNILAALDATTGAIGG